MTGASRGIGRAVALELARREMSVAVGFATRADEAEKTLASMEEAGGRGTCVRIDVGDAQSVDRAFAEVEEELGPVSVLVNNAGTREDSLALKMTDDAWQRVLQTNLFGTFACCRRSLRGMLRAGWGRIVNVSSVAGIAGSPGQANYAASKAGVIALTKTLAREVSRKGITVNAVAPGFIETPMTSGLNEAARHAMLDQIPLKRPGSDLDVAYTVAFLASDEAGYITGQVINVNGGMYM